MLRPQRYAYQNILDCVLSPHQVLMQTCAVPICVHAAMDEATHLVEGTSQANMVDKVKKLRSTNTSMTGWRGLGRRQFAARSRELRNLVRDQGWNTGIVPTMLAGYDPSAPRLF